MTNILMSGRRPAGVLTLAAAAAIVLGACSGGSSSHAQLATSQGSAAATTTTQAGTGTSTPSGPTLNVDLSEFKVTPSSTTLAPGTYTLTIHNSGQMQHELVVFKTSLAPNAYPMQDGSLNEDGAGLTKVSDGDNLDPGTTQTRTIDLTAPGTYLFTCNLPGHFEAGMHTIVTVS